MSAWLTVPLLLLLPAVAAAQAADSTAASPPPYPAATAPPEVGLPPGAASPTQSASVANPAVSVIGWFEAISGNDSTVQEKAFELREAELGFQAAVDPFTRADFFLSAGPSGLDVEEGYITWLALPGGGQAKLGRFRADLGKFNRTHPPETPFADRPLPAAVFLGAEGLSTIGVSASTLVPNPAHAYWDLTANVGVPPDSGESPVAAPGARGDLLWLGRTSLFLPLRESADLNFGFSYASTPAAPELRPRGGRTALLAGDLTFHWKNPRRSIYRSVLAQAEMLSDRGTAADAPRRSGVFGYVIYQFARQWKLGARADWSESPFLSGHATAGLALVAWQPSEFSTLSLQARRVRDFDGRDRDAGFFKWTFNIGPHGAHPY